MPTPRCPYFGKCGGCATQHLDYAVQLENKRKTLAQAIDFKSEKIQVFSDSEYGYRNRMDLVFHPRGLGMREKGTWRFIVNVEHCAIANDPLNRLLKEIRDFFWKVGDVDAFDVQKRAGTFRYAVIRTPQSDASISFVLNTDSMRLDAAVHQIEAFSKVTSAKNILVTRVPHHTEVSIGSDYFVVKGTDTLSATYLGKTFSFSAQGFFQNNDRMAEKMHEYVHGLIKKYNVSPWAHLLDLYGGVGTFGIINAEFFKGVTIVESFAGCIDSAKENIAANQIKNAEAIVLDAMHLKKLTFPKPLFVITDPPRSGMHEKTIEQLKKLEPEVIIYVSCNVQQLGKDIPKFKKYRLKSAALFDLFPQTNHMESVVELVRMD